MWVFLLISLWDQSPSNSEGVSFYSETILVVLSKFDGKMTFHLTETYNYCVCISAQKN